MLTPQGKRTTEVHVSSRGCARADELCLIKAEDLADPALSNIISLAAQGIGGVGKVSDARQKRAQRLLKEAIEKGIVQL